MKNEAARLQALQAYQILDSLPAREFDRLTQLAAVICDTPISLVSLVDKERDWFKSKVGIDICEISRDLAFCHYTVQEFQPLEVEDATKDPRFRNNPLVTGEPHLRYYFGIPLTDPDGHNLGTLCVIDYRSRHLSESQKECVTMLAQAAIDLIVEQRSKEELRHFQTLFHLSQNIICLLDSQGVLRKVNPAFGDMLGWGADALADKTIYDLIHPLDRTVMTRVLERVHDGNSSEFATRVRCNDGSQKTIQWATTGERQTGFLFAIGRDITKEQEKDALLRISENRFRSFFENSQGLMCTHDLTGTVLSVNVAGARILGYLPSELIGRNLAEIIHPAYLDNLKEYQRLILERGQASGLMHTRKTDGSVLIWLYNNVLEVDAEGNTYVIGNAVDITERHYLENDLKRTKVQLEETNEVARIGTWELDLQSNDLYWSPVTKAIHGVAPDYRPDYEQALEFYQGQHREDILQTIQNAIDTGNPYDVELQIVDTSGKSLWVRTIGKPEFENGVCTRLYGTFQDINEKKESELLLVNEKLRLAAFVEHSPAAVAMLDTELRYVVVSKRWREDYHISDVIGRSQYEVFPSLSEKWRALSNAALHGQSARGNEDKWQPDGLDHDLYLRWEILPWYQYDGSIGGVMVFTEDVTASCVQREELKRAKIHAEQASVAKSEFLANMSHEIRTPLNGVIGFTDLVLKTDLSGTQQQYLSIVNQSANQLLSIINDILDFSKIEAGKLELDIEQANIFDISSQAADIVTYQVQKKGLEMLLNIPANLPTFIWTDSVRLKQILVNLLGNAVKFTEKGEIELKIAALSDVDQPYVDFRFEVRDTGIGIKEEKQEKIFEAFSQEDASTTKRYGGTGLGLTISNKLLGMMGSKLQLRSKPGKGSCFFFDVRLKAEKGEPVSEKSLNHIKRVLIVDDNQNNREILRQLLRLHNIDSHEATNGFEALQLIAKQNQYDAILMDYQMPFMDGIETVRKIRDNFKGAPADLPVILQHSSSDDDYLLQACRELNITRRIVKPIKKQELYDALYRLSAPLTENTEKRSPLSSALDNRDISILVVEDNQVNKLLAKTILQRIAPNATIFEASNGAEAVELHEKVDLILMDIQMPLMNGYEATQRIRVAETTRRVPIIALTAGNVKGEKEKCLAAGMDDFVAKPFVEDNIRQVFSVWLPASSPGTNPVHENDSQHSHFDIGTVERMVDGDNDLTRELLGLARTELQNSALQLASVADVESLARIGHKLYGTAISAGMPVLASLSSQLETTKETRERSQCLVEKIDLEISRIILLIDQHLH